MLLMSLQIHPGTANSMAGLARREKIFNKPGKPAVVFVALKKPLKRYASRCDYRRRFLNILNLVAVAGRPGLMRH